MADELALSDSLADPQRALDADFVERARADAIDTRREDLRLARRSA